MKLKINLTKGLNELEMIAVSSMLSHLMHFALNTVHEITPLYSPQSNGMAKKEKSNTQRNNERRVDKFRVTTNYVGGNPLC